MFALNSPHYLSLILALAFSLLVHFSLTGFTDKLETFLVSFITFPVALMALSLFIPQDYLQIASYLIITSGFILASYKLPKRIVSLLNSLKYVSTKEKWIIAAVVVYLLSFFMSATVLGGIGLIQDALVYHLGGPKEWALYLNGAKFNPNNPITFTTSYYDYYYYFLFLLIKPLFLYLAPLATTQYEFLSYTMVVAAQIFTAVVGLIYIPLLIIRFSSSLGVYKYLTIFFIFGIRLITWSWVLPKNDPYSFLCFLIGVDLFYQHYILKKDNENLSSVFLASFIVGIGTASKLTNAYVVIFSLLFLVSFHYQDIKIYMNKIGLFRTISIVSAGLILGAAIFLLRNFIYTGNPFYPIAIFGFPNLYISDYAYRPAAYNLPGNWTDALHKIKMHIWDQPQLLVLLILALFSKTRALSLFYICMVVYMAKQTGPMFSFRMTTIFLILSLILFISAVKHFDQNINLKYKNIYSGLFVFFILIFAKVQVEKLVKIPAKFYAQTTGEIIKSNVDYWDILLKTNLQNRNNPKYVFAPTQEIFPYFSRYPAISLFDSVPRYRYDYFTKTSTSPCQTPTCH